MVKLYMQGTNQIHSTTVAEATLTLIVFIYLYISLSIHTIMYKKNSSIYVQFSIAIV